MDWSIKQYIEDSCDLHGKPVYSEMRYKASVMVGVLNNSVIIPLNKNENVKFILIHTLIISFNPDGGVNLLNFYDKRFPAEPIFQARKNGGYVFGIYEFPYVVKANTFTLIAELPTDWLSFSLGYQVVTQERKKTNDL